MTRVAVLSGVLLAGTLFGCYSFNESSVPSHVKSVAVPVVDNLTPEPGLEQTVTDTITAEFVRDGVLQVEPVGRAHSAVLGVVTGYVNRVFGFNAEEQTEEYEVVISMSVEYRDLVKRKTLWKNDRMVGRSTYFVVETQGQPAQDELSGRRAAIERLAADILARTVRAGAWN